MRMDKKEKNDRSGLICANRCGAVVCSINY